MVESFSTVTVLGALRQPVRLEMLPSGSECGTFDLILRERTSAGQWYSTVVPCQLWGKHLDAAGSCSQGKPVCFRANWPGARRRKAMVCVSGFSLEPFALPTPPDAPAYAARN
jgi:hypothetical protein